MSAPGSVELDEDQLLGGNGGSKVLLAQDEDIGGGLGVGVNTSKEGGGGKTDEGDSSRKTHGCKECVGREGGEVKRVRVKRKKMREMKSKR